MKVNLQFQLTFLGSYNAELYELKKISKTGLYKIPKRRYSFRFPSHLLSYAVVCCGGVLRYDCPILPLQTGDKLYETSNSL